jgi:hypothetical protein
MVSLLVARRAVTLVPAPPGAASREDLERAALVVPRYRELMDRLSWARPLFEGAVAASHVGGEDALGDVRRMWGRIESEDDWTPLRAWMRWSLAEEPEPLLDALCLDMLRGGPDPGISVPVAAGVDQFAGRFGLIVARSHPKSLAQRAEGAFARTLASWSMPAYIQADAARLLHARDVLAEELDALRVAVECVAAGHGSVADVRSAARAYGERFAEHESDLLADADDEVRPIAGAVSLSVVAMPADVALRSSADAAAAVGGARARKAHKPGDLGGAAHGSGEVLSLVVKVMGRDGMKNASGRASVGQ